MAFTTVSGAKGEARKKEDTRRRMSRVSGSRKPEITQIFLGL